MTSTTSSAPPSSELVIFTQEQINNLLPAREEMCHAFDSVRAEGYTHNLQLVIRGSHGELPSSRPEHPIRYQIVSGVLSFDISNEHQGELYPAKFIDVTARLLHGGVAGPDGVVYVVGAKPDVSQAKTERATQLRKKIKQLEEEMKQTLENIGQLRETLEQKENGRERLINELRQLQERIY